MGFSDQHITCLSLLTILLVVSTYGAEVILPQMPTLPTSQFIIDPGTTQAKFYATSRRGYPLMNSTLPWHSKDAQFYKRLYFVLETEDGLVFRLKLSRNSNLLPRQQVNSRHNVLRNNLREDFNCLYSGFIVDDPTSAVAINLCNGMGSMMSNFDGEFIIEPATKYEIHKPVWHVKMTRTSLATDYISELTTPMPRLKRRARSVSESDVTFDKRKRNIEILVVADHRMVEKYGTEEATTYILTVMNMVSSVFKDKSLGADINIVLAGLIFLTGNETDLDIGHKADDTLNSFCKWQSSLQSEIQHDHALLMTGIDICVNRNVPCDTIGYAPIRGMCSSTRSCTVNEDRGLGVAFTIAHEIGHNLGMVHDGDINDCTEEGSIMGPSLTTSTGIFFWSTCNQRQLASFLSSEQSACLLKDTPVKSDIYNTTISELPGQIYSADQQCKHLYGDHASVCHFELPNGVDICRYLWCYVGGMRCETKFLPAAEGTKCDDEKWCRQGECISQSQQSPEPINGEWADWSSWSECTRTCGGGVQSRLRYCSNPAPRYGGEYCVGESKEYERCNLDTCQDTSVSFRTQQCSSYNDKPFKNGRYYEWSPVDSRYLAKKDQCKLFCRAAKYNFFFQMNEQVIDGTRCDDNSNSLDVCITGKCQTVGCDGVILSTAQVDKCGVCNGDGSTCETVRGIFIDQDISQDNYTTFLHIPQGARNIHIKELRASSSFLAVKSGDQYYLNGHWSMDWPGKFQVAGVDFSYNRLFSGLEMLYSTGPINQSIDIQILGVAGNPGVQYEYVIPLDETRIRYTWQTTASDCTQSCGGGFQDIKATCVSRSSSDKVPDENCDSNDKPNIGRFMCNTEPCQPRWFVTTWSQCSKHCGGGRQKREIRCMQRFGPNDDRRIRNKYCKHLDRPQRSRRCNVEECQPQWKEGEWSECSASCGQGLMRRSVYCTGSKDQVLNDRACTKTKPHVYQKCNKKECTVDWYISHWSHCSATCGEGRQIRKIICISREESNFNEEVESTLCSHIPRPNVQLQRQCVLNKYCPLWRTGDWGSCAMTCGNSERSRKVTCVNAAGEPTSGCDQNEKPSAIQRCQLAECTTVVPTTAPLELTTETLRLASTSPQIDSQCIDSKSWCDALAVYRYYCTRDYYKRVCCRTCSEGD